MKNSDGNSAYIDVASNDIPPMKIEYKWLTSAVVGKDDFIREFIKRDLFNTNDLSKLQWRINGKKLTKDKLIEYLKSSEAKGVINSIESNKKYQLFKNFDELIGITDKNISDFADQYYNTIFK